MKRALIFILLFAACHSRLTSFVFAGEEKFFEIKAKKFSYTPNIIKVNKGDLVKIRLVSEDVHHGFFLDGYGLKTSAHPGQEGSLSFAADKSGRFSFRCSVTCGMHHPYMIGYLYVKPNYLFLIGGCFVFLLGLCSLIVMFRKKQKDEKFKLFGLFPYDWKFELTKFKVVRNLFKNRWFPFIAILFNLFVFVIILIAFFSGGMGAGNYNFGVMIVWILWWVLLMLFMVPIVGRIWCMVCPFPMFSDWFQRGRLVSVVRQRLGGLNKKWPTKLKNLWPLVVLFWVTTWFSAFFTVQPIASFMLIGTIFFLATVLGLFFEKRTFCITCCAVSGFQGLYANFSLCEVRVKNPEICKKHVHKTCIVGNEKGYGCPWMEMPYDMNRNTYCGLCLECFKTCPYDNMAFNIRPFAKDLFEPRRKTDDVYNRRSYDEAFKALTMIGIFTAFFLPFQGPYGYLRDNMRAATLGGFFTYLSEALVIDFLLIPGIYLLFTYLSKKFSRSTAVKLKQVFVNFSYCLVPMGLAAWIGFSIGIILPNGSYILHIISDPFAWGWNLFGTANFPWTPVLTGLMPYLQTLVVIVGFIFTLDFGIKFSQQTYMTIEEARRGWIPIVVFLIGLSIVFLKLFVG